VVIINRAFNTYHPTVSVGDGVAQIEILPRSLLTYLFTLA
jgi:hypothetical protein